MSTQKTKNMTQIALFAVIIALCAWICIPTALPFTMQTFGLFLALDVLGGKKGCAVVLVYLLLGAAGLPVFSGGQGGIGILMGATGGYLMGMLPAAATIWLLETFCDSLRKRAFSMVLGLGVCYAFGTVWYVFLFAGHGSLGAALAYCVLPFVIPDLLKISLALLVGERVKKTLP